MAKSPNLSADPRVLCCFADQETARPYESALINCDVSSLRARHGMHAYWLANSSKPRLVIVDARIANRENDFLLNRIQGNEKLAGLRVLVISDADLPATLTKQFVAIPSRIAPAELASRVSGMVDDLDQTNTQNIDDFFSMWDGVAQNEFQLSESSYIRTDHAGEVSVRPSQDSVRKSRTGAGQ